MDLEILRARLFAGVPSVRAKQEYFCLNVTQYRLRQLMEFRCDKNIINEKNCFKCCYNLYPDRQVGTTCGIVKYLCSGHSDVALFVNYPQKSFCTFFKMR